MFLKEFLRLHCIPRTWSTVGLQQNSSLLSPQEKWDLKDSLPEVGSQVERWSKGLICDNRGADANSTDRDDIRVAVLYEEVHLVLEFLSVIQVGYDSHRHLGLGGNHSFTGFNPPA